MNTPFVGQEKSIVALFSDIRGFSHMFEVLPARNVYIFTNRFFTSASKIISKFKGKIDNIIGDGLMAIWGHSGWSEKSPIFAVRTALEMRMELLRENIQFKWKAHFPLEIGIGLAMGNALNCLVGPPEEAIDTYFGKPVILASRLGDMAKNNQILISQEIAEKVKKWAKLVEAAPTEIQGFKNKIKYYKVKGLMDFALKEGERRKSSNIRFIVPEVIGMIFPKINSRKPAILKNISATGAGIEIIPKEDTPLNPEEEIIIDVKRFSIPGISEIPGRIVQVRKLTDESDEERPLVQVGISFTDINNEKKEILQRFHMI